MGDVFFSKRNLLGWNSGECACRGLFERKERQGVLMMLRSGRPWLSKKIDVKWSNQAIISDYMYNSVNWARMYIEDHITTI